MKSSNVFTFSFLPVFLLGLTISLLGAWNQSAVNQQTAEDNVKHASNKIADAIVARIELYQYGLRGARGAVIAAGESGITRNIFQRYSQTRDIQSEFPGARGFGFIRRVRAEEEETFVAAARRDGKPDFTVQQIEPHTGDRYIIQYLEPLSSNLQAVGLDIASETKRRTAAKLAANTGTTQLTGPITLVQAKGNPYQSFLILMPIYSRITTPATQAEREADLVGWSYAPLLMQEILESLAPDRNTTYLTLQDITVPEEPIVFYSSQQQSAAGLKIMTQQSSRDLFGRKWQFTYSVNPLFIQQLHLTSPYLIFAVGAVISLLLGIVTGGFGIQRQREKKLTATQAQLATIVKCAIDGIISSDLDGTVLSWNKGAEHIFGFSAEQAVGKNLTSLVVPQDLQHEEADILARIGRGEYIPHFNSVRLRRDGSKVPVSIAIGPILNSEGKVIGASKTIRDITEQKAAEDRILDLNLNLEVQVTQRTAQLELARRSLQTILDAVPSMIGYWDKHLINRVANNAYYDWFGVPADTIPGMSAEALLGKDLFARNRPIMEAALRGEPQTFERSIPKPDGSGLRHSLAHYLPDINQGEVKGFYAIVHDVTDITEANKRLEKAQRENQALLSTINQQMLYSATDTQGKILDVNANFCTASGYSASELIGQNHNILNSSCHSAEFWSHLWVTITRGESWHGEICNRTKQGELRWFDTVIAPFSDASGKIERYVALCSDITERKQAETERNKLSLLFGNVLNAASEVAIIATDLEGTISIFNTGAERMLGYRAEEIVGKTSPIIIHNLEEVMARGQEISAEYGMAIEGFRIFVHKSELEGSETRNWTYVRKDGSPLQVSLTVTAMRDHLGNLTGYLGIATDITHELQQKRDLKFTISQLGTAAEVAELGVWTWDIHSNNLDWNERMFEIYAQPLSLRHQGLEYRHWYERLHPEDAEAAAASLTAALEGRGVYEPIFRIITPDGKIRSIQAAAQVERDKLGNPIKVTGINRDISAQLELEARLIDAKEKADAASAAKSSFLANMSHEIRTPMNAVLGMLQLMQQTPLNNRQQDYVNKTQIAAKSLLSLLNDILDLSKIDADKLQLDKHPFAPESLMRDLAVILSSTQRGKPVEVLFDLDQRLPHILVGDRLRLQQILINLAGNALKFTAEGQVIVSIRVLQQTASECHLQIAVSDTGIGISREQLTRIFEGFVQAEASTTRRFGGTGLGLVICKRLVELMGGNLQVESTPDKGSRFWFDISLNLAEDTDSKTSGDHKEQTLAGLQLLVVDDNPISREILNRTLTQLGAQVDEAPGGLDAVKKVYDCVDRGRTYDVILMDWKMPDLDGYSAAELLSKIPHQGKPPMVIMVTAFAREEIAGLSANGSAPYVELLTKPATTQQISTAILCALQPVVAMPPQQTPEPRPTPLKGLTLLVVEDNELNRQVAFELLTSEGAQVLLAENGLEGVATVVAGQHNLDLVIMDMQMPDIDGLEATRRIRAHANFTRLPILAMTANASQADRDACLAAGMTDHIGKPIEMTELIPRILALTGRPDYAPAPVAQRPPRHLDTSAVEALSMIKSRFGNNLDLYQRTLLSFSPATARSLELLQRQSTQQNNSDIAATLHSIKGVASTMGAKALAARASELEKNCKANPSSAASLITPQQLSELQDLLDSSIASLNEQLDYYNKANVRPTAATPQLTIAEWKKTLCEILPLLESDNLQAIEMTEILYASSPEHLQARTKVLLTQVSALDFPTAMETLIHLQQET